MEEYRTGYLAQKGMVLAVIYSIPADEELAKKLNMTMDFKTPPTWQVRDDGEELQIYYEAKADNYNFPVYKKATGDVYKAALRDIKRAAKAAAA